MRIIYYKATSPADAFTAAGKDTKNWDFPAMEVLAEMAGRLREGYRPTNAGSDYDCFCDGGFFKLTNDPVKGYGISLVQLCGRESGIDDPMAQEILNFHRDRSGQALFAVQLLVWSSHVSSLDDLDRGYALLVKANLIKNTGNEVIVEIGEEQLRRSTYVVRSRRPLGG